MDKTIEIDDALVKAAQEKTGEADERAAVEAAVKGYLGSSPVNERSLPSLSRYAGQFEFAEGYDPVSERGARGVPD